MSYNLQIADRFEEQLARVPKHLVKRLRPLIRSLAENPRPTGAKKLQGKHTTYRVRLGDYRLIYEVDDKERTVIIRDFGNRSSIYRNI